MATRRGPKPDNQDVFVNCPFDDDYRILHYAVFFVLGACGFEGRCALESGDSSQNRFDRICRLIGECRLAIHDLSRVELDAANNLPRFNMPLELGIFLGAKRFGGKAQNRKSCLILDSEPYRYQKYCSDISGVDIGSHGNTVNGIIGTVRVWLRKETRRLLPYEPDLCNRFDDFWRHFLVTAQSLGFAHPEEDVSFPDFLDILSKWLKKNPVGNITE